MKLLAVEEFDAESSCCDELSNDDDSIDTFNPKDPYDQGYHDEKCFTTETAVKWASHVVQNVTDHLYLVASTPSIDLSF